VNEKRRRILKIESLHKGDQGWTGLLDYHDRRKEKRRMKKKNIAEKK
jgi:hypothetical protein